MFSCDIAEASGGALPGGTDIVVSDLGHLVFRSEPGWNRNRRLEI